LYRIVLTDEPMIGYCRLIWNQHVVEWSDLDPISQIEGMRGLSATESLLRSLLKPTKMNLASFGNKVAHLHWHIIPRFADDAFFPEPVWGQKQRTEVGRRLPDHFMDHMRNGLHRILENPSK
jgi:diadenosine tetraphosphate (Ap4A) HIT family hydrolase